MTPFVFYSLNRPDLSLHNELLFLRASARTLLNFHRLRVIISNQMYSLKVPLRVLVQSTGWVGRPGLNRVSSYFQREKLVKFLWRRFLILHAILYYFLLGETGRWTGQLLF